MMTKDPLEQGIADARYLRKDAAATDQTIAGTGTITMSAYSITHTAGSLTMSSGQLAVTWGTNTVAATFLNNSIAGGVAGSFQRSGTGGTALQVGDNATLTNFTVTAAGAFTASAASTITVAASSVGLTINYPSGTGGSTAAFKVQAAGVNGLQVYQTASQFAIDIGPTTSAWGSGGSIINLQTQSGTALTINSNVSSGANTGFTLSLSNSPTTFLNGFASAYVFPGAAPASVASNGTAAINGVITGAVGGASSGVTGQTGGTGSTWTYTAGAGGAVAGASGIGGAGGGHTMTAGNGGNGAATGGAGGAISITAGNAGTGGNANGGNITLGLGAKTGSGTAGVFALRDATPTTILGIGYTGLVTTYGTIATEGWGVGGILKQGYQVASSGAGAQNTVIATYTPAAAGLYLVEGTASVVTADTVTVTVTYTDSVNTTAQTITVMNAVVMAGNSSTSWRIMLDANTSTAISTQITVSSQAGTKCSASVMRAR